jgi:hypothetical protein
MEARMSDVHDGTMEERLRRAGEALAEAREQWEMGLAPQCADTCRRAALVLVQLFLDAGELVDEAAHERFGQAHGSAMRAALIASGAREDMNPSMDRVFRLMVAVESFLEEHSLVSAPGDA